MSAEDVKTLKEEESRRKRWETLNEDKKQECCRLIELMDRLEQELLISARQGSEGTELGN